MPSIFDTQPGERDVNGVRQPLVVSDPSPYDDPLRSLLKKSGYDPNAPTFPGLIGPVFNVKAFGAIGDGITNDRIAITAAVDAAAAVSGDVHFPPGTYLTDAAISVPNFVRLIGCGWGSLLRASGAGHFILNLNPANRSHISNLRFDAAVVQNSAGGGIDFRNAGQNIRLDHLYFGNNLYNGLFIAPSSGSQGIYFIDRVRWNFVTGTVNGIVIGDGSNMVTDVYLSNIVGSALSGGSDVSAWITIRNQSDTVELTNCLFYRGDKGIVVGENAAGDVTGCKFTNVIVDFMSNAQGGLKIAKCRDFKLHNLSVQTCGRGVDLDSLARDVSFIGGTVQNCTASGFTAFTGAARFDIVGMTIDANNQGNGTFDDGIEIGANVSDWRVSHCRIGNFALSGGHQKYGIQIVSGSSTKYRITDNSFEGNETAPVNDVPGVAYRRGNAFSTGPSQGRAVLVAGTVTVSTAEVVAADNIQLTRVVTGGTVGHLSVGTITAGTSFVINSSSGSDTSTIFWEIVH